MLNGLRLGDDIDDFCIKCKRVTTHAIVALVNEEPARVRCRTCYHDHDFLHEQAPPPKVPKPKVVPSEQAKNAVKPIVE
jgi:hypothetical protein